MVYKTELSCAIRGHHVYKITWFLVINEKFDCKKDDREEALSYDKHAVGLFFFKKNFALAVAVVPQKSEVGLVVPAKYTAATKKLRVATVLSKKLLKLQK